MSFLNGDYFIPMDPAANCFLVGVLESTTPNSYLLKDKGSFKFSIDDLFHSQISKEDLVGVPLLKGCHYNESDTQWIGLAFPIG